MRFSRWDYKVWLRRALYAVILLLLYALQNTEGLFPRPFGARAFLLIPAVVCIGMYERALSGLFFGLLAGLLWDSVLLSSNYYAIYLCLIGMICGTFTQYIMRNNIMTATFLNAGALLLFSLLRWGFSVDIHAFSFSLQSLLTFYLPSFLYTLLFAPLVYLLVRFLSRNLATVHAEEAPGVN